MVRSIYDGSGSACFPKGPSTHYLWFLVTIKAPKSLNKDYLEPQGFIAQRYHKVPTLRVHVPK